MYTPAPGTPQHEQPPILQAVPQQQDKPKAPPKSKSGDIGSFVQQCISLCAYFKELETQAHLIHLNYENPNFLGVHGFLKNQYEAHVEQFDTLSEFIRSMDYLMPMCGCGLKDALPSFQAVTSYKGNEMLATYYKNLEQCANMCKKIEPQAQKITAIDIANYMADVVGQMFKAAWFIKATLRTS
jgi:DNA-binding ferritin-like protein